MPIQNSNIVNKNIVTIQHNQRNITMPIQNANPTNINIECARLDRIRIQRQLQRIARLAKFSQAWDLAVVNAKRRPMAQNPFTKRMILDTPSSWARVRRRYNVTPGELRDRRQTEAVQVDALTITLHADYTGIYQRFNANDIEEADFDLGNQIKNLKEVLNLFLPRLQSGRRFFMNLGNLHCTLTLEKYEDLMKLIIFKMENSHMVSFDASSESDSEIISNIEAGDMTVLTITHPMDRVGERSFTRDSGDFFPCVHGFEDEKLCEDLALLGCWQDVDPENYDNNCLLLVFKAAGVAKSALAAMRTQFLRRKISRHKLSLIADEHKLYITVRTDGDQNVVKLGVENDHPIELALFKEHYFHFYKTKYNSYAIKNYDDLKSKKDWWKFISAKKRKSDRGMNSLDLMRVILTTNHVKKIDITTEGIFRTQFYDKFSTTDFKTLEYPEDHSVLHHGARDGFPNIARRLRSRNKREESEAYEMYVRCGVIKIIKFMPGNAGKSDEELCNF